MDIEPCPSRASRNDAHSLSAADHDPKEGSTRQHGNTCCRRQLQLLRTHVAKKVRQSVAIYILHSARMPLGAGKLDCRGIDFFCVKRRTTQECNRNVVRFQAYRHRSFRRRIDGDRNGIKRRGYQKFRWTSVLLDRRTSSAERMQALRDAPPFSISGLSTLANSLQIPCSLLSCRHMPA